MLGRPGYTPELCGIIRTATAQERHIARLILCKLDFTRSKLEVDRPVSR
jgi:hypothetical protein